VDLSVHQLHQLVATYLGLVVPSLLQVEVHHILLVEAYLEFKMHHKH
jgi:hypothetical protein